MSIAAIATREAANVLIIDLSGRIDTTTSMDIEDAINEQVTDKVIQKYDGVILNLKEVEFVSSAGLRIIVGLAKRVDPFLKKFMMVEMRENVRTVFKISGLDNVLKIYDTEDKALGQVGSN